MQFYDVLRLFIGYFYDVQVEEKQINFFLISKLTVNKIKTKYKLFF
jgi:hypothetical protein